MSNFVITNSLEKFENGILDFTSRGLKESAREILNRTYFASYYKRGYQNENYLSFEGQGFVCTIGTFVYKGYTGNTALKYLYEEFNNNYELIQNNAILQGTIIIKKGDLIKIFCDKYNVHWTYYVNQNGTFYISSSLSNTLRSLDKKVLKVDNLIEAITQRGTMGHNMFYESVNRLFGNEIITINLESEFHLGNYKYKEYDFTGSTKDEIIALFSDEFLKMIENLHSAFGNEIAIHQSGGLDSRLILAGFLKLGYKPNLLYGLSNTPLSSQYNEDKKIVEKIGKKYDLKTYLMNWNINGIIGEDETIESFNKYGFNCNENFCNTNWYKEYNENVGKFGKLILDGHMGETLNIEGENSIFNGNYPKEFEMAKIFDEYQKVFFNNFLWKSDQRKSKHLEYLKSELSELTDNYFNLPHKNGKMNIEDYQKYWWLRYRPADAHPTNLFNEFYNSISPLGISKLHDITLNLPFALIKNRGFSINIIDKWVPGLNSVGLFSRATVSKIKAGKIVRTGGKKQEFINKVYHNTPLPFIEIYRSIKKIQQARKITPSEPMRDFYTNELLNNKLFNEIFDFEKHKGDVRVLATTYIYLKGIESIGYDMIT